MLFVVVAVQPLSIGCIPMNMCFSITVAYNSASVMIVGDIPTPQLVLLLFISLLMRDDDLPVVVVLFLVVESPPTTESPLHCW